MSANVFLAKVLRFSPGLAWVVGAAVGSWTSWRWYTLQNGSGELDDYLAGSTLHNCPIKG